jgi:hypothetical protein
MVETTLAILESATLGTVNTVVLKPPLGMVIAKVLVTVLLGLEVLLGIILLTLIAMVM